MNTLVIGGGGFLGTRIVSMLLEEGHFVRVFGRQRYPHIEKLGAECIKGDLCDENALEKSLEGIDTVFHVAAKAGYWGKLEDYRRVNVDGTRNVLSAMRKQGVKKLIFTSSPSVVGFDDHLSNGGPDVPYPEKHESPYSQTKAEAEQIVLASNSPSIATVAIRPHMIFGPEDRHVFPRLIKKGIKGGMIRIGDGKNLIDLTYVDNAAAAHIDAAKALISYNSSCAGKAYFISNGEPVVFYDYLNNLFNDLGIKKIGMGLSLWWGRCIGRFFEFIYKFFSIKGEPPLTYYLANMMALDHWYDMEPAQKDLGYRVRVTMSEGRKRTLSWLKEYLTLPGKN